MKHKTVSLAAEILIREVLRRAPRGVSEQALQRVLQVAQRAQEDPGAEVTCSMSEAVRPLVLGAMEEQIELLLDSRIWLFESDDYRS